MSMLTRDQILAAKDYSTSIVDMTEEWGGEIKLKALSLKQQVEYEALRENMEESIMYLVMCSCVDEQGNQIFNKDDIEALTNKDAQAILKVFKEALLLNTVKQDDIEQRAKN